jgi:polyisoprenyl-phosphate glycosyltransferase
VNTPERVPVAVVVPVYSGEEYLDELVGELLKVRTDWTASGAPFHLAEVIFVDDNAIDGSAAVLDRLSAAHSWVTVLHLSRNFGQHPATIAGILHSSGDWVVTMDEDLQHPPARIVELLRKAIESGSDVVYAQPVSNVHKKAIRDFSSRFYKQMIEALTHNKFVRMFNSFRLIRGPVARAAAAICNHDTYFDIALSWFTNRFNQVSMTLEDRRFIETGKSGYSLKSLMSHARRMLFTSRLDIIRYGGLFGFIVAGLSVLAVIGLAAQQIFWPGAVVVQGWASTVLLIAFFGGSTILVLGILLEYMVMLVQRAHGKPLFFIVDRSIDEPLKDYFADQP